MGLSSIFGFFHCGESTIHFHSRLYKRVIVRGRSGLSTYGFLAGASRQPSLNHGSPLWQRARAAAFGPHFKSNQCLIHHGPLGFRAALHVQELSGATPGCLWHGPPSSLPARVCVCAFTLIELEGGPIAPGSFPSGFICLLTKLGDFDIYISRC